MARTGRRAHARRSRRGRTAIGRQRSSRFSVATMRAPATCSRQHGAHQMTWSRASTTRVARTETTIEPKQPSPLEKKRNIASRYPSERGRYRDARAGGSPETRLASAAMYVSMSRLRIDPERAPELVAAFRDRIGLDDGFDGFVDLQVWQSDRDPGELVMVSRWDTRAHFTAYMRSREHKLSHGRIDPGPDAPIALERLEHLHPYEVVAE